MAPPAPESRAGEPLALTPAQALLRKQVLDAVPSPHTRRNYAKALDDLFQFCASRPLSRSLLMEWRAGMEFLSPSTINVRLSAVRKMVGEARRNNMIGSEEAASLTDIPNISQKGSRLGNWLTREQAKELLAVPDRSTLKGKRDYVILALLVGCALRRNELAELDVATIQQREGRWVLADLEGKGRRIRTVAIPIWVKQGINAWMTAAGIEDGRLLRSISKSGKINRDTLSDWAVWSVVEQSSKQIGIEHFGAHDLLRTCAKLCRKNGGDLEQIKFLLGHSSIQTTERYLGAEQGYRNRGKRQSWLVGSQGERLYLCGRDPEVSWRDSAKIRPGGRNAGTMKRRVCSYDMFAVPDPSFVLKDTVGEMYFCNLRCFCVWSVLLATRPNLSEEDKNSAYSLTTPSGEEHQFAGIVDVARWATATAFG